MSACPCGSHLNFSQCSKPFLTEKGTAKTAEQLMRSRYTAYSKANISYIVRTQTGKAAEGFSMAEARQWALNAKWLGLKVLAVEFGTEHDQSGAVEFIATYKIHGKVQHIHELSQFEKVQGEWKYVSGNLLIQN